MRKFAAIVIFAHVALSSAAQTEATQYFMNSIPQVSINNPAFVPKYKFSLGLPGISSIATTYTNNGFSYNDLITKSNGETNADLNKWTKALTNKNYITNTTQVDLLRIGVKINPKLYIQVSATAKEYARLMLPKELSSILVQGTEPLVGKSTSFSPQFEGMAYIESAAGASYKVNDKLTVGARFKYIKGLLNATTVSSNMSIAVGNNYQLTASSDLNVKTSGVYDVTHSGYSFGKEFKNYMSNSGAGIDLGATYQLTDRILLAASIVDFGKITWKNNLYSYTLNKAMANYTFSGIDANKLVQGNTQYLGAQGDSIQNKFSLQKQQISSYSTWLPGKMYLSGSYKLMRNLNVGALLFTEKFQGRFSQGGSVSLNKHFGHWVSTLVSYTISNRSFNNLGAGVSFNLAPFQFYVVGDNLLRIPASLIATQQLNSYINSTQVFNLRVGLNFVWGWDKEKEQIEKNTKSYNGKKKGSNKQKVTDGDPSYLKVRKRTRMPD